MKKVKKKLKKLSDIPTWFDIRKYDNVLSFGLKEWHEQITGRRSTANFIYFEYKDGSITKIEACIIWENFIKTNPIVKKNDKLILEMIKGFDAVISDGTQESIRDFSARDLSNINRAIHLSCNDDELSLLCKNETTDDMLRDPQKMINLMNTSIQLDSDVYCWISKNAVALTANLEASDEQLTNDFKAWLKHARINFNSSAAEKMFTDIDFKDWCEYALLPYFDLSTWAKLNGYEFTNSIMSQAIFPNAGIDGFCGESRVRRETKPRSAEIFNNNTISVMDAQVRKLSNN